MSTQTSLLLQVSEALALCAIFLATIFIPKFLQWRSRMRKLNAIPTVGYSGFFSSYISACKFKTHAREIILEGYSKYPGQAFKVPLPDRWEVIVSGKEMIEDIRKASHLDLSFTEAIGEFMQSDYTLGKAARVDTYQIDVVRTSLTRNLGAKFDELRDEIKAALAEEIHAKETEWLRVPMLSTLMKIVARTSNRYFVGLPLCRDPDYIKLNIEFTVDASNGARVLRRYPAILKPIVRQLLTNVPSCIKRATGHLELLIRERLEKEEEYGSSDWPGKPNDLISWLLDEAQGERRQDIIYNIVSRVLLINFGSIHTTSAACTNALFYLAANPHLVRPLREEVESIVAESGWTKAAMDKMHKLDSFLKETQRLSGTGGVNLIRKVLRDFTFSNGTVVPAGAIVSVALLGMHHDDTLYEDPEEMKAFRFSDMRSKEGEELKHQMVGTDPAYILFGGGRHMCPGRFFAVNELKALIGEILLAYDLKLENGELPEPDWQGASLSPNRFAQVMFKRRIPGSA
ncbi:cytochrome P450 [Lentinula raphanica]|uniref:Cytochrome P450 n=1 Tax=Lentinula raphanica TaxID=153919 RepID=A0AA38PAJ1_9AGAR|nr:cytochrome P450 [Lentinula raphanica]